jgi:hypothetical protein
MVATLQSGGRFISSGSFGDVDRNATSFIAREALHHRAPALLVLEVQH